MGVVCAIVYMLLLISFIPFAFYRDIVAATSGGGNRDVVLGVPEVETGRYLALFPHSKVGIHLSFLWFWKEREREKEKLIKKEFVIACFIPFRTFVPTIRHYSWNWR